MLIYFIVASLLYVGFLSLMFHDSVRQEIESAINRNKRFDVIISYFGYVVGAGMVAYLWPLSLLVLAISAGIMVGLAHDKTR